MNLEGIDIQNNAIVLNMIKLNLDCAQLRYLLEARRSLEAGQCLQI